MLIKARSAASLLGRALGTAVKTIMATAAQFATREQMIPANAKAFHFTAK